MRFRTLEIRWHDSKPISSCDFQPVSSFKKARPQSGTSHDEWWASQSYRLATGGEDNSVRIWMVYPNIRPMTATSSSSSSSSSAVAPRPPRVEYLASLVKHSAAVNVVRWSPNGELIASAGDDGMIIIWSPTPTPPTPIYGSDVSTEELQHEKEFWRARCMIRCCSMPVYDIAWSPTGDYIIAGSTDNAARIFQTSDGACVLAIAEHNHYVQGVSWDPLNEYVATQSSDRSMHIYRITPPNESKNGVFEASAVGKNTNISINMATRSRKHARTPSNVSEGRATSVRGSSRPALFRRESTTSDAESAISEFPKEDSILFSASMTGKDSAPLTPATSVASTPSFPATGISSSMFPPPPVDKDRQPSSRRSSFSGSNAPSSPAPSNFSLGRYGRSPSPMPALPAIRTAISSPRNYSEERWKSVGLYGDESYTNFFRRLTFSPDGGLLVTPAGQFEDPQVILPMLTKGPSAEEHTPTRGRKTRPSISTDLANIVPASNKDTNSCVYIYTRANFARPPVAQLPGYKKPSVAVKFNPLLFSLRPGVAYTSGASTPQPKGHEPITATLGEAGVEGSMIIDVIGQVSALDTVPKTPSTGTTPANSQYASAHSSTQSSISIAAPAPRSVGEPAFNLIPSPGLSPVDLKPSTPAASKPGTPTPWTPSQTPAQNSGQLATGSVFALPYRMLFAVVTMDTVAIYDTQQAGPFCMLTKLHYDEFTDVTWSPDGQCLLLSSRDGYCTLVTFDEILTPHPTQQASLQLQSIAHHHSVPLDYTTPSTSGPSLHGDQIAATPIGTPVFSSSNLPQTPIQNRLISSSTELPPTPGASTDGDISMLAGISSDKRELDQSEPDTATLPAEPPKKKRRVALTRVGDID